MSAIVKNWSVPVREADGEVAALDEDHAAVLGRVWNTWLDLISRGDHDQTATVAAAVTALGSVDVKELLHPARLRLLADMSHVLAKRIDPDRADLRWETAGPGAGTVVMTVTSVAGFDVAGGVEAVRIAVHYGPGVVTVELRVDPDVLSGEEQYLIDHIDATILPA